ncbi:MAG: class I SAM-dependent methyltransferase [Candidatus Thermoplasmatota archaeon]|nr:class I SAM-dependent methyltransferase [Candidatus Thermoplasmatota archaeon]MCL5793418.1 class I SAM-dependent methyltransferase [Candidatus Thermoplasmatota archaeon]
MNEGSKLEEIVNSVEHLVKGMRILDVGTGFGTVMSRLLQHPEYSVVTVDPEAWVFDKIEKEYALDLKSGRLKLVRSKAEDLPFEDQSFDSSLAVCSLHHLNDPVKGLIEMERVTSGRIIVTDWDVGSSGSHNPHSPEHLGRIKGAILSYAGKNGYEIREMGNWYLVYR